MSKSHVKEIERETKEYGKIRITTWGRWSRKPEFRVDNSDLAGVSDSNLTGVNDLDLTGRDVSDIWGARDLFPSPGTTIEIPSQSLHLISQRSILMIARPYMTYDVEITIRNYLLMACQKVS